MRCDLIIQNATLVSPWGQTQGNLYVKDGRIVALGRLEAQAASVVEAEGLYALPGMVDGHVHFMDPGPTEREDFITGSSAAAVGGVTTVVEHTHAQPVLTPELLREKAQYLSDRSLVDYGLTAHVWPDRIDQVRELWAAGALLLKVFTCNTHGVPAILPGDLLRLFQSVASFDGLCLVHCEDEFITADNERRLREAGRSDFGIIPEWRSREAELTATATVALLACLTGARTIVAHVSHPPVVDLLLRERALGARLWLESCPQYLYLREEEVLTHGPLRKFTPPARARSQEEADEMWRRIALGHITHISTDHAPSTRAQKAEGDIWSVHFGLPGVETTFTMLLNGVNQGYISLERLVELVCETPACLYGLYPRKGVLQVGSDADVVLVDLHRERVLSDDQVVSKAGWTPFSGHRVRGQPVKVFLRGQMVAEEGKVVAEPGVGRFVTR
ncbi:MAG: dihydroorotase family protein, partial [Dehalococcoidia bacterium]